MKQAAQGMEPQPPNHQWMAIFKALSDIRDSWMILALAVKDHLAEESSPERDEVKRQVEQQLARIRGKK